MAQCRTLFRMERLGDRVTAIRQKAGPWVDYSTQTFCLGDESIESCRPVVRGDGATVSVLDGLGLAARGTKMSLSGEFYAVEFGADETNYTASGEIREVTLDCADQVYLLSEVKGWRIHTDVCGLYEGGSSHGPMRARDRVVDTVIVTEREGERPVVVEIDRRDL